MGAMLELQEKKKQVTTEVGKITKREGIDSVMKGNKLYTWRFSFSLLLVTTRM